MNHAVIDIGTNTFILLIGRPKGKTGIDVLHDEAVITRLGQGLTDNHCFSADAMKRCEETLVHFAETCKKFKVKKIVAVGTAACRTAANTQVFINAIKKKCGFKIDVISGNQEAEYVFLSAWRDFGSAKNKILVIDIGGGSTEIIAGPSKRKGPESLISLPFGSVKLTELYVRSDPISLEDFNRLHLAVRNGLHDELYEFYKKDFDPSDYTLIATAGTATTLAAVSKKMARYNSDRIHGSELKKETLETLLLELAQKSVKERQTMKGMAPLRADVILAGGLLLNEILRYFKQSKATISDRGLRYGVFTKKFLK